MYNIFIATSCMFYTYFLGIHRQSLSFLPWMVSVQLSERVTFCVDVSDKNGFGRKSSKEAPTVGSSTAIM